MLMETSLSHPGRFSHIKGSVHISAAMRQNGSTSSSLDGRLKKLASSSEENFTDFLMNG